MFFTLTYDRSKSIPETWNQITRTFNHYITDLRRFHHNKIQYLRVVEEHKDGYPHIHTLIQFSDARIRVQNSRYFDRRLYAQWKDRWKHGHSDVQPPRGTRGAVLAYVLKYVLKNVTTNTIWKKILTSNTEEDTTNGSDQQQSSQENANSATYGDQKTQEQETTISANPVKKYGVKLVTWSRDFDFKPFIAQNNNKPCPKRDTSTHLTFK